VDGVEAAASPLAAAFAEAGFAATARGLLKRGHRTAEVEPVPVEP
jgi:hypothetical protein